MRKLRQVGVTELKNRLSALLREVRKGRRILVTSRGRVVAELRRARAAETSAETLRREWLEEGFLRPPQRRKAPLPPLAVRLPDGVGGAILDDLRGGNAGAGRAESLTAG